MTSTVCSPEVVACNSFTSTYINGQIFKQFITAHKVAARQCFTAVCVILFTGGGSLSRGVFFQGGLCQGDPPYGNVRLVRILLECILVCGSAAYR